MSVVAQPVRFPLIYRKKLHYIVLENALPAPLSSNWQLKSSLTYFFNTSITVPRLCLFFDSSLRYKATNLSIFLFVLCSPLNIKLSLRREYGIPLQCYIFKILLGHFVPMLGKMSQICSSIPYYENHLTHKNWKCDYTSSSTGQLIISLQVVN